MFTSKKKLQAAFLKNHGQVKEETFYFNKINRYFEGSDKSDVRQVISEKICSDLNLDELFMHIDRTASKVGQQYLYYLLRTIPNDRTHALKLEGLVAYFEKNPKQRETILLKIHSLHKDEADHLSGLFLDDHIQKPKWFWAVKVLAGISVISFLLAIFYPPFFLLLIGILAINYFIHYWNKNNLFRYAEALPQLLILNRVAKQIANIKTTPEENIKLEKFFKSIDSMGKQMMLFKLEAKLQSDVGAAMEYVVEIVKALFLIEPIVLFSILKEINLKRKEIAEIFRYVGEMDAAISILSLRQNLPFFTIPSITEKSKRISGIDIYHPLIEDCVYNSIELDNKSALLTGSNMSGKTTFIRTIGINALTAQTINTCFAREFEMPTLTIHSAISISDDLMSEKSYYFEEVLRIKEMIDESRSGNQNLFLLDEMFKGTNTVERIAGGKSVLDYLNSDDNIVIISTHDLEMTEYLKDTFNLYHFTENFKDDSIIFDYKLKPGNLKTTNAIRILELNQYPPEIIKEARRLSNEINSKKVSKF